MPWNKTFDSVISNYHMNGFKRRVNSNAYYSPTVDRFFAVDSFDPYTALEIAQILSSKMPAIVVCILTSQDIIIDSTNCIEYTIKEKNLKSGPASVLYGRQTPTLHKVPNGTTVLKKVEGFPKDFKDNEQYQTFLKFHEYAKFTILCWHAMKLSAALHNLLPTEEISENILQDLVPDNMVVPADNSNGKLDVSISKKTRQILYTSNSIEEALRSIEEIWNLNASAMTISWRKHFYYFMELPDPKEKDQVKKVDRLTLGAL